MPTGQPQPLDRRGVTAAMFAFGFWGLVPIYYKELQSVDAWQVLAHRIVWAIPVLLTVLAVRDGRRILTRLKISAAALGWLTLTGLMIAINWGVYVWAIVHDHVLDTSLGYFMTPLINVILGFAFLQERLTRYQTLAVISAAAGTLYFAWYLGGAPWISVALALSFGFYGLMRKRLDVGPLLGLLWETLLMGVPAALYLLWLSAHGRLLLLPLTDHVNLLLVASGLPTILPLIWFNMAARRLPLSILGFFQYFSPSISFMLAVFLYGEAFTFGHAVAFTGIWLGLVLVSIEPFQRARKRLRG